MMFENFTVKVGQDVPNFRLDVLDTAAVEFSEISLERLKAERKWTILFFYPGDFTFVCATEFAAIAAKYEEFKRLGAEVITVSKDTKYAHLVWQRVEKMLEDVKYPMGADPTGNISRLFGVYDESSGLALRGTFIISPDGKLMNSEINYFNIGRNIDELMRKFKANRYLANHDSEACPAQWAEEGDQTLTPSIKMVGKVYEQYGKE